MAALDFYGTGCDRLFIYGLSRGDGDTNRHTDIVTDTECYCDFNVYADFYGNCYGCVKRDTLANAHTDSNAYTGTCYTHATSGR